MRQRLIYNSLAEIMNLKMFKSFVKGKTNSMFESVGVDNIPPMLYVLANDGFQNNIESVRVSGHFVSKIIHGYEDDVIAFMFAHRVHLYSMPPEELAELLKSGIPLDEIASPRRVMVLYYEDNLLKVSHYHDIEENPITGQHLLSDRPFQSSVSEEHPAFVNLSNLHTIN
jgi:hypothetical protein